MNCLGLLRTCRDYGFSLEETFSAFASHSDELEDGEIFLGFLITSTFAVNEGGNLNAAGLIDNFLEVYAKGYR